MTAIEVEQYFQYHNSNMKLLKIGFEHVRSQIKILHIKKDKTNNFTHLLNDTNPEKIEVVKIEKSLSRILSGIQVSWAEESIKRLFYEKNLLTDNQRNYLLQRPALDQRWYKTLKVVFCIAYDLVPIGDETCETVKIENERRNLGNELVDQYLELKSIIKDQLVPNFSIRNKVQHGEWEFAFKPSYSIDYSQDLTDKVNYENIITATSRYTLVNAFYQMLVDLGRFKSNSFALDSMVTPFEYFYNNFMRKIKFEITKINSSDLDLFITQKLEKEIRGQHYKTV